MLVFLIASEQQVRRGTYYRFGLRQSALYPITHSTDPHCASDGLQCYIPAGKEQNPLPQWHTTLSKKFGGTGQIV